MDPCIWMAEALCYSPDTITTLFVNWLYPDTKEKVKKKKTLLDLAKFIHVKEGRGNPSNSLQPR